MFDYINKVICGDCLEVMKELPDNCVDLIVTDPPYPDYHVDKYGFVDIGFLTRFQCRQFIFWSAKAEFPLDYTAIHIWDKQTGAASQYERIFERNGQSNYKVFRHYLINSSVAANYTYDTYWSHPSQKPIRLIRNLIELYTKPNDIICDPFLGSGTTALACKELGRGFIGIEINPDYCKIAEQRLKQEILPLTTSESKYIYSETS